MQGKLLRFNRSRNRMPRSRGIEKERRRVAYQWKEYKDRLLLVKQPMLDCNLELD